jgi:predicted RNA-binding protein with TRAM domain
MKKTFIAVLHLKTYRESVKVYQLAGRVITNCTNNQALFNDLMPSISDLNNENTKLDTLIRSKDGSKINNQAIEDQSLKVYGMLKDFLIFVNKVAQGDKATILLSGFDCNEEFTVHNIPEKPVIKRIEDGRTPNSAKIFVDAVTDADRYKVEINTIANDAAGWKTVLDPASIFTLEIANLSRGVEIWIRVTAGNCHGWGTASDAIGFIPR